MDGFWEQNKGKVMEYNGAGFATVDRRIFSFSPISCESSARNSRGRKIQLLIGGGLQLWKKQMEDWDVSGEVFATEGRERRFLPKLTAYFQRQ